MKHLMRNTQQKKAKTQFWQIRRWLLFGWKIFARKLSLSGLEKSKKNILVRRECPYMLISSSQRVLMEAYRRRHFSLVFTNVNKIPKMCWASMKMLSKNLRKFIHILQRFLLNPIMLDATIPCTHLKHCIKFVEDKILSF